MSERNRKQRDRPTAAPLADRAPPKPAARMRWPWIAAVIGVAAALALLGGRFLRRPAGEGQMTAPAAAPQGAPAAKPTDADLEREAMEVIACLVREFPDRADPLGLMGDLHAERGQSAEAIACWEKCARLEPRHASSHVRLAHTAVERGDFQAAVEIASRALAIHPRMPGIHSELGRALRGLGKPEEALAAFEMAAQIPPPSPVSHHLLGQAYQDLEQFERAKQSYLKALDLDPGFAEAYYGLSRVCARLGQDEAAASYRAKFKQLRDLQWQSLPDKRDFIRYHTHQLGAVQRAADAHTNAGLLYSALGRDPLAEQHWLRAAEIAPQHAGCREQLTSLYQRTGRTEEALRVCEQLRQIAPDNPMYHLGAARLLERMGRVEAARRAVGNAIALDPANADYRRILEQIGGGK